MMDERATEAESNGGFKFLSFCSATHKKGKTSVTKFIYSVFCIAPKQKKKAQIQIINPIQIQNLILLQSVIFIIKYFYVST